MGSETPAELGQVAILIVEDNPADAELLRRSLLRCGIDNARIRVVATAAEAQAACEESPPDCLLLDYRLNDTDGLSMLAQLSRRPRKLPIPVVIVTGQGSEEVAVAAMKFGAHDYVTKDGLTVERLKRAIVEAIRRSLLERKSRQRLDSLSMFVDAVTHDLRRPLTSLGLNLDLYRECTELGDAEDSKRWMDATFEAYEQLKDMLESLHRLVSSENTRFAESVVDLSSAVDLALRPLRPLITQRQVHIERDVLPSVLADGALVVEVIQNLVENAISHNSGDDLHIRIMPAFNGDNAEQSFAGFVVVDNGKGLSDEALANMFEPLWRDWRSGVEPQGKSMHSGLGLAICTRLMERMGGKIVADNAPDGGARFFVLFSTFLQGSLEAVTSSVNLNVPVEL